MTRNEIDKFLYSILRKFRPDEEKLRDLWNKGRSLPLTGEKWGFNGIDLTYLFFEVEQAFQIVISPNSITNYQFNTIESIVNIVDSYLSATSRKVVSK